MGITGLCALESLTMRRATYFIGMVKRSCGERSFFGLWTQKKLCGWSNLCSQSFVALESSSKWTAVEEQKKISANFCKIGDTWLYGSTEQGWHSEESVWSPLLPQITGFQQDWKLTLMRWREDSAIIFKRKAISEEHFNLPSPERGMISHEEKKIKKLLHRNRKE